jgi:hypothetical protein
MLALTTHRDTVYKMAIDLSLPRINEANIVRFANDVDPTIRLLDDVLLAEAPENQALRSRYDASHTEDLVRCGSHGSAELYMRIGFDTYDRTIGFVTMLATSIEQAEELTGMMYPWVDFEGGPAIRKV